MKKRLQQEPINVGDVYKIPMTFEDGITPKDGQSQRLKYFIVLGFDKIGNVVGGVVINSNINHNLPTCITDYYMPISCRMYPFLHYDSFVNCSQLKTAKRERLQEGNKVGAINGADCALIVDAIVTSPNETRIRLKAFGLIK